ncbi:MAG: hypothetical protein ACUZ8I_14940 [Candidatus Scalindua sp.]
MKECRDCDALCDEDALRCRCGHEFERDKVVLECKTCGSNDVYKPVKAKKTKEFIYWLCLDHTPKGLWGWREKMIKAQQEKHPEFAIKNPSEEDRRDMITMAKSFAMRKSPKPKRETRLKYDEQELLGQTKQISQEDIDNVNLDRFAGLDKAVKEAYAEMNVE